jgi:hypothetical protein
LEKAGKDGNIQSAESIFAVFMKEYKELELIIRESFDRQ